MLNKELKFSYNDIAVVPAAVSSINHRAECNPYDVFGMLPIFTAPMTSVINEGNFDIFEKNKIHAILPRPTKLETRLEYSKSGKWSAYSLSEFKSHFVDPNDDLEKLISENEDVKIRCLIDIANGHMKSMMELVRKSKERYGKNIKIMVGNIANPRTYEDICRCGADYVRLGVGSGAGCITSTNTSIHYPLASLIDETVAIKRELGGENLPKVIADGGIRNYSDVIKALALGADYVMIGGLFSKCLESAAETYRYEDGYKIPVDNEKIVEISDRKVELTDGPYYKKFYGMASREGQIDLNGEKTHTSEGIAKEMKVKYLLPQWRENMTDYLRSAMSYTDSKDLYDLIHDTSTIVMSGNTYNSINK